jgi:hypothetical protein
MDNYEYENEACWCRIRDTESMFENMITELNKYFTYQ